MWWWVGHMVSTARNRPPTAANATILSILHPLFCAPLMSTPRNRTSGMLQEWERQGTDQGKGQASGQMAVGIAPGSKHPSTHLKVAVRPLMAPYRRAVPPGRTAATTCSGRRGWGVSC